MKRCNWKIYVIAHKAVYDSMYKRDKRFNNANYVILNVGSEEELENEEQYHRINQKDLVGFTQLGKWWAESEGIYNIWKSGQFKELDYIGFLHYDKELKLIKRNILGMQSTNITARIEKYLKGKKKAHISFENHNPRQDYGQKIMADITQPNTLQGDGLNCYDYILADYNSYFGTDYKLDDFLGKENINLCSCFLIDIGTFDKMMKFFDWVVQSKRLEVFDTEHKYRLQGGLAERYFGVFLMFEYKESLDLSLIHHYNDGIK